MGSLVALCWREGRIRLHLLALRRSKCPLHVVDEAQKLKVAFVSPHAAVANAGIAEPSLQRREDILHRRADRRDQGVVALLPAAERRSAVPLCG